MFTQQQFLSALRWALTSLGVYLTNKGLVAGGTWEAIVGAVLAIGPFIWSMIRHTKVGTIVAANDLTEVAGVITTSNAEGQQMARDVPSNTVVAANTPQAAAVAQSRVAA